MFADFLARRRGEREARGDELASGRRERSWAFRAYLLWLTFPPIVLLFQDEPFRLIIIYGVLGAAFMPFLALTLMWLLGNLPHPARMAQRPPQQRHAHRRRPALPRPVREADLAGPAVVGVLLTTPVLSGTRPCPEGCFVLPGCRRVV
ncbi:hypothetical protein STENM327S_03059 [Streptomyces tendae]